MTENLSEESYRLEGIAFGLADGLIMCLGLIIGIAEATSNAQLVIITGVIGALQMPLVIPSGFSCLNPRKEHCRFVKQWIMG